MPTPNLALPYISQGQAQKEVTHNDALNLLDAVVQLAVLDRDLAAPPGSPAQGARYLVAPPAGGDWMGRENHVAAFLDGAWTFFAPKLGWRAWIADEAALFAWNGNAWQPITGASPSELQNLSLLGVGTTADAVNPFSAKLNNALFTAQTAGEGGSGDLRYKMNKETAANTLSLLFQTNWSGRAEIGLTGTDDLTFKVSADGATWREAASMDRSTGDFVIGGWRVGRDAVMNALPDSGRFNGNGNNSVFSGITYAAPSYLNPVSGGSIASYAKFIHNNTTYGGSGGALDPEVDALISKIRPNAGDRLFGPEWFVVLVTQTTGTMSETVTIGSETYGLPYTNTFTALPKKYTAGFYVKVKSGKAAAVIPAADKGRAHIDGLLYAGGSSPVVLQNADGWKYVNLQSGPNQFFYNYRAFDLITTAGAQFYLAMPRLVFGHVDIDPNLGVLMNNKMFG